jgi:signal peptidase II
VVAAVAAVVVTADQLTKTWALDHAVAPGRHLVGPLWFEATLNPGAAFGLGRGVTPIVETVVIVLVVGLLLFGRWAARVASLPAAVAVGLLLGGAVGNLADRIVRHHRGAVVDFIAAARIGDHDWWPVFNVADASIVVGALLLVALWTRPTKRVELPTRSSPDD